MKAASKPTNNKTKNKQRDYPSAIHPQKQTTKKREQKLNLNLRKPENLLRD